MRTGVIPLALPLLLFGSGPLALAQSTSSTAAVSASAALEGPNYQLRPRELAPGVWVIEGAVEDFSRANGCNIINTGFLVTGAGVVVINTGPSRLYGEQMRAAIQAVTHEPVVEVLNLNLHPDYYFGNQAFQGIPLRALPGSIQGMQAEGSSYEGNLYALCGDWMAGTQSTPAHQPVEPRRWTLGNKTLETRRLEGHTADDLVLIDHSTGVLFAGGLIFKDRAPTTPHAHLGRWKASLEQLQASHRTGEWRWVIPSHGPVHEGVEGLRQTLGWLEWSDQQMTDMAVRGMDLSEALAVPLPAPYTTWAANPAEWHRSLTQLFPSYEKAALERP